MLKIRLARVGKKKQPSYRVVVADSRAPRDGKYVEIVGNYNPRTQPESFEINEDKVRDWLAKGAQPTLRMQKLLAKRGLVNAPTFPPPKAKAAPEPAAAPAAPAATAVAEPEASAEAPAEAEAEEPAAEPEAEEPAAEAEATEEAAAEEEQA